VHLTRNSLIHTYLLKFWWQCRSFTALVLTLMVLLKGTPSTRASQKHLAFPPCGNEAKSYYDSD
jgi:hypothetical protein